MQDIGSVTIWIDQLKQGDEAAAASLWERYFVQLVNLARLKMRDMPNRGMDEEDVALSALRAVFCSARSNGMPELSDRDSLWRTLVFVTGGKAIDARRKAFSLKRGGRSQAHDGQKIAGLSNRQELECLLSKEPDPALALMIEEEFEQLLNQLGDDELRVIALAKLSGFTHADISQQLGCNERTIKRRLALIRRIWEETEDGK